MSRGPGRWQRQILELIEKRAGWVTVDDVLRAVSVDAGNQLDSPVNPCSDPVTVDPRHPWDTPVNTSRSQREAARRAIRSLAAAGHVETSHVPVDRPIAKNMHAHRRFTWRYQLAARRPLTPVQQDHEQQAADSAA